MITGMEKEQTKPLVRKPTAPRPVYPPELEEWWLRESCGKVSRSVQFSRLDRFEKDAGRLSDAFTTEREDDLSGYAIDARQIKVYGLYFFPQTFVRMSMLLAELDAYRGRPVFGPRALRVLDLGSGSGASVFAAAHRYSRKHEVDLHAVDRSRLMLKNMTSIHKELGQTLWPQARLTTYAADIARPMDWPVGRWDLILCCFALNELFPGRPEEEKAWLNAAIARLSRTGVLVLCEPATKDAAVRMAALREHARQNRQVDLLGPCLHREACPMPPERGLWCHEVRRWTAPDSLRHLNRNLYRPIDVLKYTFLAFGVRRGPKISPTEGMDAAPADLARLVAPLHEQKGRIATRGCAADGKLWFYEQFTRGLTRREKKDVLTVERGDILQSPLVKELGDGRTRRVEDLRRRQFHFEEAAVPEGKAKIHSPRPPRKKKAAKTASPDKPQPVDAPLP